MQMRAFFSPETRGEMGENPRPEVRQMRQHLDVRDVFGLDVQMLAQRSQPLSHRHTPRESLNSRSDFFFVLNLSSDTALSIKKPEP